MERRRYVSDLQAPGTAFPVRIVETDGQVIARGLPLMRVGTWNGWEYTIDDLRQIAANHGLVREADGTEPALLPRHGIDADGKPVEMDSREVMAWFTALYVDEATQTLLGDVRIVDYDMRFDMAEGKLRYLSTEIWDGYTLAPAEGEAEGQNIGRVMKACAWVTDPAVKGLEWELVVNRAEFDDGNTTDGARTGSADTRPGSGEGRTNPAITRTLSANEKGGNPMSLLEKLKALFAKAGVAEEDLATLDEVEPAANADDPGEKPVDLAAQLDAANKRIEELERAQVQTNAERTAERVNAMVDSRAAAGRVRPADRPGVVAMAMHLAGSGSVSINADGATKQVPALEAYMAQLDAAPVQVNRDSRGLTWSGSDDPDAVPPMTDEQINDLHDKV
jgi:hypothetical protein